MKLFSTSLPCCLAILLSSTIIWAQDFERIKPKELQPKEAQFELIEEGEDDMPPDSEAPVFQDPVLTEKLLGIKILSNAADIRPYGNPVTGLDADTSLPLVNKPAFRAALDPYFNQPLTLTTTFEIRRTLADFYRDHNYPVTRIIVPEQDVSSGTLQVVVLIGKRGNITVEGNRHFSENPFRNTIRLRMGETIQAEQLLSDLEWMNQNPFRSASLVYGKGDAEGMTDIHLRVQDRFPVRVFAGYENTGNDITGDERWFLGGNWGNAFNLDHQFSYQFSTSSDFELSRSHAASYLIPLPWRHTFTVYGSITETNADLPAPLNQEGTSWQASALYNMPWHPNFNYALSGSYDKTLRLWDVRVGDAVRVFTGHFAPVSCNCVSPDGRYVASGAMDGMVRIFDIRYQKEVAIMNGHRQE
ncbi:MAG: POTRA domain-containing protein, partial [Verrucomicrobiota bacterium]